MTHMDELIAEIRRTAHHRGISYNSASKAYDVYEGYLFSLIVATAAKHKARVAYEDVYGNSVQDLVFRTSPGHLFNRNVPYTHALMKFQGAPALEVHVGVRVQGRSGVLHECDVLVLPADEAHLSRSEHIAPRGSKCLLAIECKYYGSNLKIRDARNFEGLHADLGATHTLFVSNVGAPNVTKYLASRNRWEEREVVPSNMDQVGYTKNKIRESFKWYLSRHSPSTPI